MCFCRTLLYHQCQCFGLHAETEFSEEFHTYWRERGEREGEREGEGEEEEERKGR